MYQCEFMKLPIERPRIPDVFRVDDFENALFCISYNSTVTVPLAYNGKKISKIGSALMSGNKYVTSVVITEGITEIS